MIRSFGVVLHVRRMLDAFSVRDRVFFTVTVCMGWVGLVVDIHLNDMLGNWICDQCLFSAVADTVPRVWTEKIYLNEFCAARPAYASYADPIDYLKKAGGLLLDLFSHDFDMAHFLIDTDISEITAIGIVHDKEIAGVQDIGQTIYSVCFENDTNGMASSTIRARRLRTRMISQNVTVPSVCHLSAMSSRTPGRLRLMLSQWQIGTIDCKPKSTLFKHILMCPISLQYFFLNELWLHEKRRFTPLWRRFSLFLIRHAGIGQRAEQKRICTFEVSVFNLWRCPYRVKSCCADTNKRIMILRTVDQKVVQAL